MKYDCLKIPQKQIRAVIIADHVRKAGYAGIVCYSCGNAAKALKELNLYVIEISPHGQLRANKWFNPDEIHRMWPNLFDGTSGHLPIYLMVKIAKRIREYLGNLSKNKYYVPTGSGETITCLRWAYPKIEFIPIYDNNKPETKYEPKAPLNYVVEAMAPIDNTFELKGGENRDGFPDVSRSQEEGTPDDPHNRVQEEMPEIRPVRNQGKV